MYLLKDQKTLASSEATGVSSVSKSAKSKTASVDELTAANAVTNLAETAELPSAGDLRESETSLTLRRIFLRMIQKL